MTINRIHAWHIYVAAVFLAGSVLAERAEAQALNMDGQSGIFFQPWADVVPSAAGNFGGPTVSVHIVDAGPVAGDYLNAGVEEGFGNWLEFGFTRNNHTDGGDPGISPLFNFAGMSILNVKAKLLPANYHGRKYLPAISLGGVLRTNDPFVSQSVVHKNSINGDVYLAGSKLFVLGNKFAEVRLRRKRSQLAGASVRRNWLPNSDQDVIAPTFEIDQEPEKLKYVPTATLPTDLIYAVRISHASDSRWNFDIGTGHVGATLGPGINIKVNNAIAFAADFRF